GPRRRRCDEPNRSRCRTERSEETVARNQGGTMSGIDVATREPPQIVTREPEESDTFRWRFDQLVLAGYSERSARQLAMNAGVALHRACDLLASGGPEETAVAILD